MRTKETLKREIRELSIEYAKVRAKMRIESRAGRTLSAEDLACAAHEILTSIAHRQGLLVQVLENQIEYGVAA